MFDYLRWTCGWSHRSEFHGWKVSLVRAKVLASTSPRIRTHVASRRHATSMDSASCEFTFTVPLKNRGPVHFFVRQPRFNWMSLLRCRALLSRSPFRSSVYPLLPTAEIRPPPPPLLSFPPLAQHCPFADPIRRSYIYCIEETRAAAFHAHAPPVMSGLQSCLSFRPSIQRTGRPVALHAPYLVPSLVRSLPSRPSRVHLSSPLQPAILRSLGSLAIWSRHCRPGRSSTSRYTRPNCTFLARFTWHWQEIDFSFFFNPLDRGSVNENVAIVYFRESIYSPFSIVSY